MIIKASERGGARNLANHLMNAHDNEHLELYELRGVVGRSLHAALLEIDGVCQGTQSQKPFFSTSFNPPIGENVTQEQFLDAFNRMEKKLGLVDQPRAVVFHEKEGRRHAHVVWSRVDIDKMKIINLSHFKRKATDVSRELYLEHGWEMPRGLIDKRERDPFQLSNGEFQFLKRHGVDPKEIKMLCNDAWKCSDSLQSFKHALEERNLFLAKGDRRGFVVIDHTHKIYSLSRHGGIRAKDIKNRLGSPEQLPSVEETRGTIRSVFNREILGRIHNLKKHHQQEILPVQEKKALLVHIQRAQRRELNDQQRVKRHLVAKEAKDRFRRGVIGFFDKVSGRARRVRLLNLRETESLKAQQQESREKLIFEQSGERAKLQNEFTRLREEQRQERKQLAQRIYEFRQVERKRSEQLRELDSQKKTRGIREEFNSISNELDAKSARYTTDIEPSETPLSPRKKRDRTRTRRME